MPVYHTIDGRVLETALSFSGYYSSPNFGGAAPPPFALPLPKFFRNPSRSRDSGNKVNDSNDSKVRDRPYEGKTSRDPVADITREELSSSQNSSGISNINASCGSQHTSEDEQTTKRQERSWPYQAQLAKKSSAIDLLLHSSQPDLQQLWTLGKSHEIHKSRKLDGEWVEQAKRGLYMEWVQKQDRLQHLRFKLCANPITHLILPKVVNVVHWLQEHSQTQVWHGHVEDLLCDDYKTQFLIQQKPMQVEAEPMDTEDGQFKKRDGSHNIAPEKIAGTDLSTTFEEVHGNRGLRRLIVAVGLATLGSCLYMKDRLISSMLQIKRK